MAFRVTGAPSHPRSARPAFSPPAADRSDEDESPSSSPSASPRRAWVPLTASAAESKGSGHASAGAAFARPPMMVLAIPKSDMEILAEAVHGLHSRITSYVQVCLPQSNAELAQVSHSIAKLRGIISTQKTNVTEGMDALTKRLKIAHFTQLEARLTEAESTQALIAPMMKKMEVLSALQKELTELALRLEDPSTASSPQSIHQQLQSLKERACKLLAEADLPTPLLNPGVELLEEISALFQKLHVEQLKAFLLQVMNKQILPAAQADAIDLVATYNKLPAAYREKLEGAIWELAGKPNDVPEFGKHNVLKNLLRLEKALLGLPELTVPLPQRLMELVQHITITANETNADSKAFQCKIIEKMLSWLPEATRTKIFTKIWILAGKPGGDAEFGKNNALKDFKRLNKAIKALDKYPTPRPVNPFVGSGSGAAAFNPFLNSRSSAAAAAPYSKGGAAGSDSKRGATVTLASDDEDDDAAPSKSAAASKPAHKKPTATAAAASGGAAPSSGKTATEKAALRLAADNLKGFKEILPSLDALTTADRNAQVIAHLQGSSTLGITRTLEQTLCNQIYGELYNKVRPTTMDPEWAQNNAVTHLDTLIKIIEELAK